MDIFLMNTHDHHPMIIIPVICVVVIYARAQVNHSMNELRI